MVAHIIQIIFFVLSIGCFVVGYIVFGKTKKVIYGILTVIVTLIILWFIHMSIMKYTELGKDYLQSNEQFNDESGKTTQYYEDTH